MNIICDLGVNCPFMIKQNCSSKPTVMQSIHDNYLWDILLKYIEIKAKENEQETEVEGVGSLQARQTPHWIVGKKRYVCIEKEVKANTSPLHPLQLAAVPGCDPTHLYLPAQLCPQHRRSHHGPPWRAHMGVTVYPTCHAFTVVTRLYWKNNKINHADSRL